MEGHLDHSGSQALLSSLFVRPTMKCSLGSEFPQAVSRLVTWFSGVEDYLDEKILKNVVEEVLEENGAMSDFALQTAIRMRYAQKIHTVPQIPEIPLNPLGATYPRYVTRYKFLPLVGAADIRLFSFDKFVTVGEHIYCSCNIIHASLNDNPIYTAVSYAWSSIEDAVPLLIGDGQFLMVTRALMEILFRFSGADSPTDVGNRERLLWADQICINQYDFAERSKQVGMMGRIYKEAEKTKLWLGEEDDTTHQAFEVISCFEIVDPHSTPVSAIFALRGLDANDIRQKFHATFPQAVNIPAQTDPRWKALLDLLDRPWFSRLWVFQEALLSSTRQLGSVVCGQLSCSFFHLYLARSLIFVDWDISSIPVGFQMVNNLMQFYLYRNLDWLPPIPFTVWQIGGLLQAGDARDRIYGLLGVQDPAKEVQIPVDYTKSVEDVYIDFTRRCIEHDQTLRVLEFLKEGQPKQFPQLPSWVPDWSAEAITNPIEGTSSKDPKKRRFKASANLRYSSSLQESASGQLLVVKGKIVDRIVTIMEHEFKIGTPAQIEEYFSINFCVKAWVMFLKYGNELGILPKVTAEKLQAAVIRTITADGFNDVLTTQAVSETFPAVSNDEAMLIYNELERLRERSVNGLGHDGSSKDLHRKLWVNTEVCTGRKLAVLQKYWIMLGPDGARKGDRICILHGSSIPWVLRPHAEGGTYELVGQCFVDGIMYGEAVDWTEDDADTFVLV